MTRGGITTRTNVTRRSLEEFRRIGETSTIGKAGTTANVRDMGDFERSVGVKSNHDKDSDTASDEMPFQGIRMETTIEMSVLTQDGSTMETPRHGSHDSIKSMDVQEGARKPDSRL